MSNEKAKMPKKHKPSIPVLHEEDAYLQDTTQWTVPKPPDGPKYTLCRWKDIIVVYKCETCGTFMNDEGDMILHVANHSPNPEKELDDLIKKGT